MTLFTLILTWIVAILIGAVVTCVVAILINDGIKQRKIDKFNAEQAAIGRKTTAIYDDELSHTKFEVTEWQPGAANEHGYWRYIATFYSAVYDAAADRVDCGCFHGTLEEFKARIARKQRVFEATTYYASKYNDFQQQEAALKQRLNFQ